MCWVSGSGTSGTLRSWEKGAFRESSSHEEDANCCSWFDGVVYSGAARVVAQASSDKGKKKVEQSWTERVDFPAGGKIYINRSFGEVSVEGWDQASVELIVTKAIKASDTPE